MTRQLRGAVELGADSMVVPFPLVIQPNRFQAPQRVRTETARVLLIPSISLPQLFNI